MQGEKKGLVPRLRFPEFRNAGEWDVCKLGDLSTVVRGGSPRPIDGFLTKDKSGLNWLKIGDVDKEAKYVTTTQEKVISEALSKTRVVLPGDLILSNSMSFGRPYLMKIESCIHDGWIAITEISNSVRREYLYYFIFSSTSQAYFLDNAAGSGVLNLNADIIKNLPTSYPKSEEQQKIADCLSSLDALIAAQAEKIDALKTHKKGLMQQLFPREGENVPRLRFPEFRDAGEWEEGKLGDKNISTFVKERMPLEELTLESYVSTENLLPDYAGVTTSSKLPSTGSFTRYKKGDILISNIRPYLKKVWSANKDGATSNDVIVIRAKSKVRASFLTFLLKNDEFINYVMKGAKGVKMPRGDISLMKEYPVAIPANPKEQQKIADCLSSLDALIAAHAEKLDALKTHKKGLMQQLFPSPEAV